MVTEKLKIVKINIWFLEQKLSETNNVATTEHPIEIIVKQLSASNSKTFVYHLNLDNDEWDSVITCDLLPKSLNLQYDVDLTMHGKFSLKETCKRLAVLTTLFNSVKNLGCGRRKIAKFDGSRFIWTNTGS